MFEPCDSTQENLGEQFTAALNAHLLVSSYPRSYRNRLVRRRALRRSKFPKQIQSDEAGDDSWGVWDLKKRGENRGEHFCLRKLHIWSGANRVIQICLSYHDVEVGNLEAVEHPGCGGEQGGNRQREGQALHITAAHHF